MNDMQNAEKPDAMLVLTRAAIGRCPRCGEGKLFAGYLKPVAQCSVCAEPLGIIRADDGPAWLTILIVGHIMAPLLMTFIPGTAWPDWVSMTVWPLLTLALTLMVLPRAKGIFIGLIWRSGCSGAN